MTRPANAPKKLSAIALRVARSEESGATLLMALVFVTVFSVVMAAILSFVDVSMRTTVAVRTEAAQAAAADGAAQIAINALRQGTYTGTGNCFGANATEPLGGFYQTASGTKYSATVSCDLDTTDSGVTGGVAINSGNKPGNAILTLGTSPNSENGLYLNAKSGPGTIKVHGSIFSNSNINVDSLVSNAAVTARDDCTTSVITANPLQCKIGTVANSAGDDPAIAHPTAYAPPNQSTAVQAVPKCGKGTNYPLVMFKPGLYNNVGNLNKLTDGTNGSCIGGIFYFLPGTYYFDLGSTPWTLGTGYLVGGKANLTAGTEPSIPGSCATPVPPADPVLAGGWTSPGPGQGVEFVFGGASHVLLSQGQMELCGSYSTTAPPIAIYGLKTAVGPVPAESGCITTIGGCSLILSDSHKTNKMYIQGTTYAPLAAIDLTLNNITGQVFRYGIIARHLGITATGSADLDTPIIEVPDDSPGGTARTVVYLQVYVCPGTTACSTSGATAALKVKVGIYDPTTTPTGGARQVTVYSWSSQH